MSRPIAVLRPEPGNAATAAAVEARGHTAIRLPLFEVRSVGWRAPDPASFDALLLTSANAVRHAGPALAGLADLQVWAVGRATASAAEGAGLRVAGIGDTDGAALLDQAAQAGVNAALHLTGREHTLRQGGIIARLIPVYDSAALSVAPGRLTALAESVALVQSPRAGARLAELVPAADRAKVAIAAISLRAAAAAGKGWRQAGVPSAPDTAALIDTAIALAD